MLGRFLFLCYWLYAITFLFTQLTGQTLLFKIFACIATFGMIAMLVNTFRTFIQPSVLTVLSGFCVLWFCYMTYLDAVGTFTPIHFKTIFYVVIDLLSLLFCVRTYWNSKSGVGIYISNLVRMINDMPVLIYNRFKQQS